jgi:hypothetical protein
MDQIGRLPHLFILIAKLNTNNKMYTKREKKRKRFDIPDFIFRKEIVDWQMLKLSRVILVLLVRGSLPCLLPCGVLCP